MGYVFYDSNLGMFREYPETMAEAIAYCKELEIKINEMQKRKDENARRLKSLLKKYKKLVNDGTLIAKFYLVRQLANEYKYNGNAIYDLLDAINSMSKELEDLGIIGPMEKKES